MVPAEIMTQLYLNDGVQGTLSQNMALWHIENLRLKEFEKIAEQGRSL